MEKITLKARIILNALRHVKYGTLEMNLPDGSTRSFGSGLPIISISIKNWSAFNRMFDKGDIGLAENIIAKEIEIKEISTFIGWACQNEDHIRSAFHGRWISTLFNRLIHMLRRNSKRGSKKNILAHYDIGNEFYQQWLDPTMTYSAGIFNGEENSLETSQINKYDRIIDRLEIKSTDRVLEVGCGWGGFFRRAVERTGCHVTAILNSDKQAQYCTNLIKQHGLQNNVDLKNMDYRDIQGSFNKIVSIEMIEAVGEQFWPIYFSKLSQSLISGGKALIQAITIREDFFDQYRRNPDFIRQYIFPGGMLLTNSVMREQGKIAGLHLKEQFEFGIDYAETLKHWQNRFFTKLEPIQALGLDDRFIRIWNFYLGYCEGAFRAKRINVGQYLYEKI